MGKAGDAEHVKREMLPSARNLRSDVSRAIPVSINRTVDFLSCLSSKVLSLKRETEATVGKLAN